MSKHARYPRHTAEQTTATRIREHQAWAVVRTGQTAPGTGKHRKESVA